MGWFGADPGGKNCFGIAHVSDAGSFTAELVSCADEALQWIKNRTSFPRGLGIDCPLWWSSWGSGDRRADKWLRKRYNSASVLTTNSFRVRC
jgi:hypothetical protein